MDLKAGIDCIAGIAGNQAVDLYTRQSCLSVTRRDPVVVAATLANGGVNPLTHDRVVGAETCRCTLAAMTRAGLYETRPVTGPTTSACQLRAASAAAS